MNRNDALLYALMVANRGGGEPPKRGIGCPCGCSMGCFVIMILMALIWMPWEMIIK